MNPETQIQVDLVKWMRKTFPKMLFTSTQAGNRMSTLQAVMMKRMGYTNGTPDLIVFRATNGWNGLLLELKQEKGTVSPDQKKFKEQANAEGYKYLVAYGLEQAKDAVRDYLGGGYGQ
jgi:hypothetical protein